MGTDYLEITEIKQIINEEKQLYVGKQYIFMKWSHQRRYLIWRCLAGFRMAQYWKNVINDSKAGVLKKIYAKLAYRYYFRQRNLYGEKSGVEITNHSVLGRRLDIWHGGVIISGQLGDNCIIHGNNVIGNKGDSFGLTPVLGNGVDLGVGAVVIGGVHIADGCKIGANAVVIDDFNESESLIVGIPAQMKG